MLYITAQLYVDVKDKVCVDGCPAGCIYGGSRPLYIDSNECVGYGVHEPVCPVETIFYEDDPSDKWAQYRDAAVNFFAEVGDLGGVSANGPIGKDSERVTVLPPQNQ